MSLLNIPEGFIIGAASAAYQVEGAWDKEGKGESIWDHLVHTRPDFTVDSSNGDVACDSYNQYKEDVKLLSEVGFDFYRFSISWPRILPDGEDHSVNEAGVRYYNNLIDELLAKGIQPMVTMYHWDLPQKLQEMGGWLNPLMADYFEDYARILFTKFGQKVKWWITINELQEIVVGYAGDFYAPAVHFLGSGEYLAGHTLIRAHAKAYRLYDKQFRSSQLGKVSISLNSRYHFPLTSSIEDKQAAETMLQFELGWFAHPIFSSEGDYPEAMRQRVDQKSKLEGRSRSRLPTFTPEELLQIRGSYDFFGLNHYTSCLATFGDQLGDMRRKTHEIDAGVVLSSDPAWPCTPAPWIKVAPKGLRCLLQRIKERYNNVPVIITENGYGDNGEIDDGARVDYFLGYLRETLEAIQIDGCNVIGYTVWSIIDNFEWSFGYTLHFGLYHVDMSAPSRPRKTKKSVSLFQQILRTRQLRLK